MNISAIIAGVALLLSSARIWGQGGHWWLDEPVRLLQTNLRETDSTADPERLVDQVADFPANALLLNMGGIVAQYPTKVEWHYASPYLPEGVDFFGKALKAAHARKLRVIGRFDLSKAQKPVFDAHPEWFFKRPNGEPAVYNGLYSACINGGYYGEQANRILTEALTNYPVDGLFFNMFGNPTTDYSRVPMGNCQCDACKAKFQARYGRALPPEPDADYREFMADSAEAVAANLRDLIHRLRPNAAFITYIDEHTDAIASESNTALDRPLPLWPYSASDNVDRARNSEPDKLAFNLNMTFVDHPWRFATVPPAEIQIRHYQNLAHGGPLAMAMVGTPDQEDRQALIASRPIYRWHAEHEDLYVGQQNAARVLLLASGATADYRGWFRLLTESHIPFAVSENLKWLDDPTRRYDLVIAPGTRGAGLEAYVRQGGRLLIAGAQPPGMQIASVVAERPAAQGYWRIRDKALFPSLRDTDLLFLNGAYIELAPEKEPPLTLIPPAMFGPPEKVWGDKTETSIPGLVFAELGKGRVAYVPWNIGAEYHQYSSPAHAGLMMDLADHLLPAGRQLKTDAHPLVEITVMRQPARHRTLVHFINLSGHADTAYHAPVEMRDIAVEVRGAFANARSVAAGRALRIAKAPGAVRFTLPKLNAYEVVVLADEANARPDE